MKKNEAIKNIMTKNVVCVNLTDAFSVAKEKMDLLGVHHIFVLEGKKLKGVISMIDILRFSTNEAYNVDEREEKEILDHNIKIEKVMTREVISLSENDTIKTAVEILTNNGFNSLPIINPENELVGLITSKDLLGYLLDQY
ncbi:MAG: CBS domain-containing protein [Legionellaceae bacterium]|nr:CBS domain-containing protein [Legionellaceae bacterium]